jgi:hypothetical protein
MKLPDVSGVYDYAGPIGNSRYRPRPYNLPPKQKRRRPDCIFSELNTQPACTPVYASPCTSRCPTQNSGRVVRCSFLVGLFHSLLHAGLSRRTALAIYHETRNAPSFRLPLNVDSKVISGMRTIVPQHHIRAQMSVSGPDQIRSVSFLARPLPSVRKMFLR